jgi:hypothetical protein
LKGRLTSMMSKMMLSVWQLSGVPKVTGWEMLPRGMIEPGPTLENGREGASLDIGICNFCKAPRLMRLRVAPPSTRTWYNLTLVMVRETSSGSCPAPTMFLGQSEASKLIDVSIHLWWAVALGAGAAAAIDQRRVLMMRLNVMSQEPLYITWIVLRHSLVLESESEWP